MSRLVDGIMFLARTESDTIRFEWRRMVLQDLVADATCEAEMLARGQDIQIEVEYPSDPVWIQADPQRLKQALMILLDNAIKYSFAGRSVFLRVKIAGEEAEVTIRDEGLGISAEDLPKVFDVAFRGAAARSPDNGVAGAGTGAGLGLAIARGLVQAHGGEISVRNHGEGCRFEVRLPVAV